MKKLFIITILIALLFAFAGCAGSDGDYYGFSYMESEISKAVSSGQVLYTANGYEFLVLEFEYHGDFEVDFEDDEPELYEAIEVEFDDGTTAETFSRKYYVDRNNSGDKIKKVTMRYIYVIPDGQTISSVIVNTADGVEEISINK